MAEAWARSFSFGWEARRSSARCHGCFSSRRLLFAVGPRAKAWLEDRHGFDGSRYPILLYAFEFIICVYGGFFGLGMGIVMLAVYALLGQEHLNAANAIKNLVVTIVTVIGIVLFWWQDLIAWLPATVMAAGAALGGFVSVQIGHLAPRPLLRNGILIWAVVLTAYAFLTRQ